MTAPNEERRSLTHAKYVPILLGALKEFGRPVPIKELSEHTGIPEATIGNVLDYATGSFERHVGKVKRTRQIVFPHYSISRHWHNWNPFYEEKKS